MEEFLQLAEDVRQFCQQAEKDDPLLNRIWNWTLMDDMVQRASQPTPLSRVAVIGSIKSGKSTYVNALLQRDALKRGAGVLTSAVTRVLPSHELKATIQWKGLEEINQEIQFSSPLLVAMTGLTPPTFTLEIQQQETRQYLTELLSQIEPFRTSLPGYALNRLSRLNALLDGYKETGTKLAQEATCKVLGGEDFGRHRKVVCRDSSAAYVNDILVEMPFPKELLPVELADCQGSDSLNSSHLAEVQEYLLGADWAIYLVNSVMGLRQADEKLLEVVKGFGLQDNLIFVLNVDIDAHSEINDLKRVQDTVIEGIKVKLGVEPRLYTVSALFELFKTLEREDKLSDRDRARFNNWQKEPEMIRLLEKRWANLNTFWSDEIAPAANRFKRRFAYRSLGNLLARLHYGVHIAADPLHADQRMLEVFVVEAEKLLPNLEAHLQGVAMKTEKMVRFRCGSFLDPSYGELAKKINLHIQEFKSLWHPGEPDNNQSEPVSYTEKVNGMVLAIAEEFNQSLNSFLTDYANREIMAEVKDIIGQIQSEFATVMEMHQAVLHNNYLKLQQNGHQGEVFHGDDASNRSIKKTNNANKQYHVRELIDDPAVDLFSLQVELPVSERALAIFQQGWMLWLKKFKAWFVKEVLKREPEDLETAREEIFIRWRKKIIQVVKKEAGNLMISEMNRFREHLKFQMLLKYIEKLRETSQKVLGKEVDNFKTDMNKVLEMNHANVEYRPPDPTLLKDWQDKLADFESRIRF